MTRVIPIDLRVEEDSPKIEEVTVVTEGVTPPNAEVEGVTTSIGDTLNVVT